MIYVLLHSPNVPIFFIMLPPILILCHQRGDKKTSEVFFALCGGIYQGTCPGWVARTPLYVASLFVIFQPVTLIGLYKKQSIKACKKSVTTSISYCVYVGSTNMPLFESLVRCNIPLLVSPEMSIRFTH
jgi:hypothetical protein